MAKRRKPRYRYVYDKGDLFRLTNAGYAALREDLVVFEGRPRGDDINLFDYDGRMVAEAVVSLDDMKKFKTDADIWAEYAKLWPDTSWAGEV